MYRYLAQQYINILLKVLSRTEKIAQSIPHRRKWTERSIEQNRENYSKYCTQKRKKEQRKKKGVDTCMYYLIPYLVPLGNTYISMKHWARKPIIDSYEFARVNPLCQAGIVLVSWDSSLDAVQIVKTWCIQVLFYDEKNCNLAHPLGYRTWTMTFEKMFFNNFLLFYLNFIIIEKTPYFQHFTGFLSITCLNPKYLKLTLQQANWQKTPK